MSEIIATSVQEWRRKAREGTLSMEEMRLATDAIRKDRIRASGTSATSKETKVAAAKKKEPIDSDSLLDGLMGDLL